MWDCKPGWNRQQGGGLLYTLRGSGLKMDLSAKSRMHLRRKVGSASWRENRTLWANESNPIFAVREGNRMLLAGAMKSALVVALLSLPAVGMAQTRIIRGSPFQPNPNLSDQEKRGLHWFLQRCALCHLPKYTKEKSKVELPVVWKSLEGLFRNAKPDKEKVVREFILKGTGRMPGFQYGLKPNEIDDLIAYLKTL